MGLDGCLVGIWKPNLDPSTECSFGPGRNFVPGPNQRCGPQRNIFEFLTGTVQRGLECGPK
eukprot:1143650-Pelagomonas_calceolata.AAC.3